jgi:hypothetical protein
LISRVKYGYTSFLEGVYNTKLSTILSLHPSQISYIIPSDIERLSLLRTSTLIMFNTKRVYELEDYWSKSNNHPFSEHGEQAFWCCPQCYYHWYEDINTILDRKDPCIKCQGKGESNRRRIPEYLRNEWIRDLNKIDISMAVTSSDYWWRCPLNPCGCHIYLARLGNKLAGTTCPYCLNRKLCAHNNLAVTHPHLQAYWELSNRRPMNEYSFGSNYQAKWKCPNCKHRWITRICSIGKDESRFSKRQQAGLNEPCPRCKRDKRHSDDYYK